MVLLSTLLATQGVTVVLTKGQWAENKRRSLNVGE